MAVVGIGADLIAEGLRRCDLDSMKQLLRTRTHGFCVASETGTQYALHCVPAHSLGTTWSIQPLPYTISCDNSYMEVSWTMPPCKTSLVLKALAHVNYNLNRTGAQRKLLPKGPKYPSIRLWGCCIRNHTRNDRSGQMQHISGI